MIQASILRQLTAPNVNGGGTLSRVSVTIIRPAALAISARYAGTLSNYFSTKAPTKASSVQAPNFANDPTFAENAWTETEEHIRKKALQNSLKKFKREAFLSDHSFDVTEEVPDHPTKPKTVETGDFLTKAVFDQSVKNDSSDHAFDENDFPGEVAHVVKGASTIVGKNGERELFESDHAFDVNSLPKK